MNKKIENINQENSDVKPENSEKEFASEVKQTIAKLSNGGLGIKTSKSKVVSSPSSGSSSGGSVCPHCGYSGNCMC